MKNAHIFFTSYPRKDQIHDEKIVGGASYTKTLLTQLKKMYPEMAISVYAEKFGKNSQEYLEDGICVKRIWKRNNIFSLIKSVLLLTQESAQNVYVSYEINMVGSPFMNILFLLMLSILQITGKTLTFIPHQVVEDFSELEGKTFKSKILNVMTSMLFNYISLISKKLIVFEEYLKNVLPDRSKVVAVPLAVEAMRPMDKAKARNILNLKPDEFVMLFFGFISPYKGLNELIDAYEPEMGKLIIAGGGNPNHLKNKEYVRFVRRIREKAAKKNITVTGFIPEYDIKTYYSAADVLVLPYKIFFSSSFPLSLAFSYELPALISKQLHKYFKSADFQDGLKTTKLTENDVVINFKKDLKEAVKNFQNKKSQFMTFSEEIKKARNIKNITKRFKEAMRK